MSPRNHWVVLYFFIASPKKGQLLNSLMGPASTSHKRETHVGFRLLKISCPRSIYSRGFLFVVLELSSWPTSVWFFSIIIIIKPNQWHTKKKPNIWWQNKKLFNYLSLYPKSSVPASDRQIRRRMLRITSSHLVFIGPALWTHQRRRRERLIWQEEEEEGTAEMSWRNSSVKTLSADGGFSPSGSGIPGLLITSLTTWSIISSSWPDPNSTQNRPGN